MIYLLQDYGFCAGVRGAIEVLKKAAKEGGDVFLTHPLLHNKSENKRLLDLYHAKLLSVDEEVHHGSVVFSAHGHDLEEEKGFTGAKLYDATCPLISKRYERLCSLEKKKLVFLGKRGHPETLGFLSRFKDMLFLDVEEDLKQQIDPWNLPSEIVLVCQTTIGKKIFLEAKNLLSRKTEIEEILPLCPLYENRLKQAESFLKDKDSTKYFLVVCGDKLSSNANELLGELQSEFPGLEGAILSQSEELPKAVIGKKDLLLCSSTSISKESVEKMYSAFLRLEQLAKLS